MVEEIKNLCKKNSTSIKALERELGFGNGTIRRWDDSAPSFDKIQKVCDYFGCSILELTGEVEQKEKPAPESRLNKDILLDLIENMSREELIEALQAISNRLIEK